MSTWPTGWARSHGMSLRCAASSPGKAFSSKVPVDSGRCSVGDPEVRKSQVTISRQRCGYDHYGLSLFANPTARLGSHHQPSSSSFSTEHTLLRE
jgi:hypothetical protein